MKLADIMKEMKEPSNKWGKYNELINEYYKTVLKLNSEQIKELHKFEFVAKKKLQLIKTGDEA